MYWCTCIAFPNEIYILIYSFCFFKGYDSANVSEFFLAGETKDKAVTYDNTTNGVSGVQRVPESSTVKIVQRRKQIHEGGNGITKDYEEISENNTTKANWKKIFLLIVAITVHNIPGIILCNMVCRVNGRMGEIAVGTRAQKDKCFHCYWIVFSQNMVYGVVWYVYGIYVYGMIW